MRLLLIFILFQFTVFNLCAQKIDKRKVYPQFALSTSGLYVTIDKARVIVQKTAEGSPAHGKFQKGDELLSINGKSLNVDDPRVVLGNELNRSGAVGTVSFESSKGSVSFKIPKTGAFSASWPLNCKKSDLIIKETADFLVKSQVKNGAFMIEGSKIHNDLSGCLAGLFLLSTGDDSYLKNVKLLVNEIADQALMNPSGSNWQLGYQGILLAEYYLRSGDKSVLKGLESLCRKAISVQAAGGWGHGGKVNSPGYVQSGLMNSAGLPVLTTLVLARECGVEVDAAAFQKALKFGYRFAGHGCAPYGDHRPELWWSNTNGRNGQLACALALLPEEKYQQAAQHLAMLVADSYVQPEFGHTGGGFNAIWRGISSSLIAQTKAKNYHRQLNALIWYYELSRQPGGGFSILPTPPDKQRYSGTHWGTGALALAFSAPLRNLRITGRKPGKFSKIQKTPDLEFGNEADLAFLGIEHASGYGNDDLSPEYLFNNLLEHASKPDADLCLRALKHYSPLVRNWAARKLKDMADTKVLSELKNLLKHPDPRVRRAVLNVFSGYDNWGRPFKTKLDAKTTSKYAYPAIEQILKDPKASLWEKDGALWALSKCDAKDIRKNLSTAWEYSKHPDWYLRESAFWVIAGLGKDINAKEFMALANIYKNSERAFVRSSYDAGFNELVRKQKVDSTVVSEQALKVLGSTAHSPVIAEGYAEGGALHEATHRTMMILSKISPDRYEILVPDLQKYLSNWKPYYQHSIWLISGSKWQPGVIKIMNDLGINGKGLRDSLKKLTEQYSSFDPKQFRREAADLEKTILAAIAEWDKKYLK